MPAISVVMPVYNTKEYVGKAIQSILDQTFSDFEFLIIDNGSTDGSGDVIARYAQADSRFVLFTTRRMCSLQRQETVH